LPLRTKALNAINRKSGTFLTYVEVGGNGNKNRVAIAPEEDDLHSLDHSPQLSYDNILGDITKTTGSMDDLEELRKMINKTKKDMNDYGKELLSLKKNIEGINDYAFKELGYGADRNLMYRMESTINSLQDENEMKALKSLNQKNFSSRVNKLYGNKGQDENSKNVSKVSSSMGSTASNILVGRKGYSSALRSAAYKVSFKK